ncbi:MAG: hypothetical protein O3A95_10905 [Planctomycetota bacterium]|nr:hypothetical protein [Planctomycetota bacterium]MDA1114792.1 hypothetical protein [Planctomycetota bacterium]
MLLLALTLLFALQTQAPKDAPPQLRASPLAVGIEKAGRFPSLTHDSNGTVYLTWYAAGEQKGETKLQQKTWNGKTWSSTQTIASGGGWMVNWADFAKFSTDASGSAMVTWLAGAHGHGGYGVMFQKRREAGAGWTDPKPLHKDREAVEHGFVSLLPLDDGNSFATWIQSTAKGPPTDLRFATYSAIGERSEEQVLDPRICDCCATAAVRLGNGDVLIAYRDRSETEVRNIQMLRGKPEPGAEWRSPKFEEPQDWKTAGCPVNGPALAADGSWVVLTYFHQNEKGQGQVKYSWSTDGGQKFSYPSILQREAKILGRVAVTMLNPELAILAWLEVDNNQAQWMACALNQQGRTGPAIVLGEVKGSRADGFLSLTNAQQGTFAAWTGSKGDSIKVSGLDLLAEERGIVE